MNKLDEVVMCWKFDPGILPCLDVFLDPKSISWLPRRECEENPDYKQIIPYVILYDIVKDAFLGYSRKSGDGRLINKVSIGLGGHINEEDKADTISQTIVKNIDRELAEEIGDRFVILGNVWDYCRGFIYDKSNSVGRVHLGFCFVVPAALNDAIFSFEDDEHKFDVMSFDYIKHLYEEPNKLETWSQSAFKKLFLKERDVPEFFLNCKTKEDKVWRSHNML